MRNTAKWIAIVWSVVSLIGIIVGMAAASTQLGSAPADEYTAAAQFVGLGCGFGIWLVIWFVIAGPATLIWAISGRQLAPHQPAAYACLSCGKVGSTDARFCTHCGHLLPATQ